MARPAPKPALVLNGEGLAEHVDLASELLAVGVEVVFRSIEELAIDIGPGGVRIRETVSGRDLADFGLVQVLAYQRPTATLLNAVADYLAIKGVRAVNVAGIGAPTKLFKYVRLANRGLSIPSTIYLPSRLLPGAFDDLAMQLDLPFVLKTVTGGGGGGTRLVGSEGVFTEALRDADHARGFLAQELVPPDGSYFLLVLGGHVPFALQHRSVGGSDLLAKSGWGDATLVDVPRLDPVARETAVQAATSLGYDIAGVRLVRHWTTGQWCVLDVSPNPPIGSGGYTAETVSAYSAYLKRRLTDPNQADAKGLLEPGATGLRLD
ncbi:RimK family alpha-L-glutamate ligase [Streptomyces sp. NPDC020681]|uniref:RimK family alpha-L-glutamate ligase n=1 Tax=Streptomyces sp. NPDC020681 TaxID=3365083 RepID=UPI0037BAA90E